MTQDQLDECLAVQSVMRERGFDMPLGQLFIEKFYLDQPSVRAMLRAQRTAADEAETGQRIDRMVKFTPTEHDCLVERIGALKLVDLEDLDSSIEIQQALSELGIEKMLGEILIERGLIGSTLVRDILDRQLTTGKILRGEIGVERRGLSFAEEAAAGSPTSTNPSDSGQAIRQSLLFGAVARELGSLVENQVSEILSCQARLKELGVIKRIGQLLVERGWLGLPDVRRILDRQKLLYGRIDWLALQSEAEVHPAPSDLRFARLLLDNGLLSPQQIQECLLVVREVRAMGFSKKDLAQVIVDKEYLDRHVVARLLGAMGEGDMTDGRLHRSVLERAARDLLDSRRMDLRALRGEGFGWASEPSGGDLAMERSSVGVDVRIVLVLTGLALAFGLVLGLLLF